MSNAPGRPGGEQHEQNAKALWQLGLDWLHEANGVATHPLDRRRAFLLARGMHRAKTSIGRSRRHEAPLYQPDRLIELHDLRPRTEERLGALAQRALERVLASAREADTAAYVDRKRELEVALSAIQHLRYLRFGPAELGIKGFDPEVPRRPG